MISSLASSLVSSLASSLVALVDRSVPEAVTLTFAKPDVRLAGGPIYAFGKGSTTGSASVIAWP